MVEAADIIEEALDIPIPTSDNLVLDDYRRLTGPGMLWEKPGAVLDIFFHGFDSNDVVAKWQTQARRVLDALGWSSQDIIARQFDGGVNLAISAPMDQLYSAIFATQTAWHFVAADLLDQAPGDFDAMIADVKGVMLREANPALLALIAAAQAHGVEALSDDDELSLGHGTGSQTWPVADLPDPSQVNWTNLYNLPVVYITGTNGKTTTTRLASAIAKAAGLVSGLTSTDFVRVGDDILERGDFSGPGGGRMLLRDPRLEAGFLEVARGGILRRGLATRQASAALVTNVASDHLGQFGVNTVEDLAVAKFAVHRALTEDGVLVLNADDTYVVAEAARTDATIWWFSLNSNAPQIKDSLKAGMPCAWYDGTSLVFFDGKMQTAIITVADIPLTLNGAARHNISNALGALCLTKAIGLANDAIHRGLAEFQSNPRDNPGRCNEFLVKGARVFVDFAHNPHSISAVTQTMAAIPAQRRIVLLSHAGDRSDQDIRDATTSAFALKPDYLVAAELPEYLRGREIGEITGLVLDVCQTMGLPQDKVRKSATPSEGVALVLEMLWPGDLALLLVLSERDKVFDMLEAAS